MRKLSLLLAAVVLAFGLAIAQEDTAAAATVALGEQGYLVDAEGMTLYMFANDSENTSVCADACLANWPALLLDGDLLAGEGLDAELLASFERDDGTTQVSYNGWPLYYYVADVEAGMTNGQGLGENWYVLDAEGNALMELAE